jgi:hypothetical protein
MEHEEETIMKIQISLRTADRFDNYHEMLARFSSTGKCGHRIRRGDLIGYNSRHGAQCSACWASWKAENAEADAIERGWMCSPW